MALLKFHWGEDVRRVRVQELSYDQVQAACLHIFAERLSPDKELQLEFRTGSKPLTRESFPELLVLHAQEQLDQSGGPQRSLRLVVSDGEMRASETRVSLEDFGSEELLQVKTELEDIPAPVTPENWSSQEVPQPQTPETPYPDVKEEPTETVKTEPEAGGFPFQADGVRKAARRLLKQVRRQREAKRREEKKAARRRRKAKCKVLKRMEKAARVAARRLARRAKGRKEKGKASRKAAREARGWRSETEEEEREEDEELEVGFLWPQSDQELTAKQLRKEGKKAARRLLRFARKARKLRKRGDGQLTGPEEDLQRMVRNAQVAFQGLFREEPLAPAV
ncbi:unnamed protein product [Effrenium voratum]|uniref:Uncharacterized protein n=1 Tax=Effrenium voratum TaxID=2562239 RepID=A0AA36N0F7_9DINO|nr:unnamed protein product [Effrenium voratum]